MFEKIYAIKWSGSRCRLSSAQNSARMNLEYSAFYMDAREVDSANARAAKTAQLRIITGFVTKIRGTGIFRLRST